MFRKSKKKPEKNSLSPRSDAAQFEAFFYHRFLELMQSRDELVHALAAFQPLRNPKSDGHVDLQAHLDQLFKGDGSVDSDYLASRGLSFDTNRGRMSLATLDQCGFNISANLSERDRMLLVAVYNMLEVEVTEAFHSDDNVEMDDDVEIVKSARRPSNQLQAYISTVDLHDIKLLFTPEFVAVDGVISSVRAAYPAQQFKDFCQDFVGSLPKHWQAFFVDDVDCQSKRSQKPNEKQASILSLANTYQRLQDELRKEECGMEDAVSRIHEKLVVVFNASKGKQKGSFFKSGVAVAAKTLIERCEECYPKIQSEADMVKGRRGL